jgi:hypothetical protein
LKTAAQKLPPEDALLYSKTPLFAIDTFQLEGKGKRQDVGFGLRNGESRGFVLITDGKKHYYTPDRHSGCPWPKAFCEKREA